jgi:hypothetical protein
MTHCNTLKNLIIILGLSLLFSAAGCSKTDLSSLGNNTTCYAAAYNKGVYKSENGGKSWYPLVAEQEDIYLYSKRLFLSPDAKTLYVTTTGNGLFSIDLRKGVLNRVDGFKDEDIRSVAFRNVSKGQYSEVEIFVGKKEIGIYKTVAGSDRWEPFNNGLTYRDVNMLYTDKAGFFVATINGIFKWGDSSGAWMDVSEGIKNRNIISLGADIQGKMIFAGAGAHQESKRIFQSRPSLYKSTDNGKTWVPSDNGLPDDISVFSIAVNPSMPERIYLGTSEGIYRSTDSGRKWSKMDGGLPDEFKVLDIMIVHLSEGKDLVYAAGVNGLFAALDEKNPKWESRSYGFEETYISDVMLQTD